MDAMDIVDIIGSTIKEECCRWMRRRYCKRDTVWPFSEAEKQMSVRRPLWLRKQHTSRSETVHDDGLQSRSGMHVVRHYVGHFR